MRLWRFAFAAALLSLPVQLVSPAQVPLTDPSTTSTTLVDALSADPDYTSLLLLLQRARLIPTLNRLNGSTLFAPTNDAIKHYSNSLWNSVLDDSTLILADNVQEKLRQQLFYHLLNYSISSLPDDSEPIKVLKTLHFPRTPVDPPSKEPPPSPPWMPIPGGSLGGEPQRLRVASRKEGVCVGVDANGKHGAEVTKGQVDAGNGVLLGVNRMLEPPPDLATVVSKLSSVSYFHNVLTPEITRTLNSTEALTLFLPVNGAWDALHPLERLYLESEYATDDLNRILNMHAVAEEEVKWSEHFDPAVNCTCPFMLTTIDGTKLEIVVSPEKTMISSADLVEPDIYASNGVLHLVSSLIIPPGALQLTPEKYLLALNCTNFVSLLHSADLTSLINDTETKYTILAPKNDVLSIFGHSDLPERGSEEMKKLLQYHFIPGYWTPKKLASGMLLETALEEKGLDGDRQVLAVDVHEDKSDSKKVFFGGASVIDEPIEVNNTLIYFISRPLEPPADALQTALPYLDLSSYLAAVFSTSIAETLKTTPRTSLLIPHNSAFKRLGLLVSAHLLAASSKRDLENVLLHHTLDTVEYSERLRNGSQHTFSSVEGSDLTLERMKNGTLYLSASGGWAGMRTELYIRDILTQTGVIHEVSDVLIPRSVQLTIGKLVKAAKGSTMTNIVTKAGFDWVLNGTAPPDGSPWADQGLSGVGWTLLCPTDDAFKEYNLTSLFEDVPRLQLTVGQHLIPTPAGRLGNLAGVDSDALNNNRPLPLDDSATYKTLRSPESAYGDIIFRQQDDGSNSYIVGIKGARGTDGTADWARVQAWGRTTTGGGTGGVIQIDRVLMPYQPPWWVEYGAPTVIGVLGIFSICAFFLGVRWSSEAPAAEETLKSSSATSESVKSFVAGGFGGVAAVLVGHPFDLTKTRLQTAPKGAYTGAFDVVKKTLAKDGFSGLYRGMVPPLLGVTPIFAVSFWAYDMSKLLIYAVTPNRKNQELSIGELAVAGFMSAIPTTLVTAPVERAKVLLQVQGQGGNEQKYKGVFDVIKHLYKEGGIRSIFRGSVATVARDGPGSAAYFAAYEVTKKALTPAGSSPADLNLGAVILAGGTAGVAMWSLAIPPDVIKSRIQSAPSGTYSGFMDCARKTIARDGVAALWKGFGPAMARAFPANAATFLGVEASRKPKASRTLSASEIARNLGHFETWSTRQNMEQVSYSDIPESIKPDVDEVLNVSGKIPIAWVKKVKFIGWENFLSDAHKECPSLFCEDHSSIDTLALYDDLATVFKASKYLKKMCNSEEKFSEADFAKTCDIFRTPAVSESRQRGQCPISLPQPLLSGDISSASLRILNTKTIIPDNVILIPTASIRHLSNTEASPYKALKAHRTVEKSGSADKASSFRFQSTPCANLPEIPGFEFASAFFEDKKPVHQMLEDAYRQNRMSTTSAVRHLHSLGIHVPVFGLVWANGTVRAHEVKILSAPFPGPDDDDERTFHEWKLKRPSDILQVHFLIRNIDYWTCHGFREKVVKGVKALEQSVINGGGTYEPWKRVGILKLSKSSSRKENRDASFSSVSTPPAPPKNTRTRRN
ncbi:hypothetical protein EV421DRAFT_1886917 [Armillaria borealis]|uniref:FAS1 domain-containing protein n=1 Tax=Armillaria borealis TaxID=47425 RepID=A0AA39KDA3_9AGAR|nr:hypothetical protein EV421DRAFT_1886917 [Armillaria borealis]